jgi:anaerobic magnesium-protoporphyrin IX monomethyl ester cyclase
MACIVFISIADRNAQGQRLMSASLRQRGHECHIIFLKPYCTGRQIARDREPLSWVGIDNRARAFSYAEPSLPSEREFGLLRRVLEEARPDVIGMTVNTPLRRLNALVAQFIRSVTPVPIIWGGYDPTVNPGDCLDFCDFVCIGEGDTAILEAAECLDRSKSLHEVHNLARRRGGSIIFHERAPLVSDLDALPWRDNTPDNKYFIDQDQLIESYPVLNDHPAGLYQTISSRGCPYRCNYCCEGVLKDLYKGEKFLRRRSPRDCVGEIAAAKAQFRIGEVLFEDEIFGMDQRWLEEFAPLYREQVALPFNAYLYPTRNIDNLMPVLKSAGLQSCTVSLQSGSRRINAEVFNRLYDRDLFLRAVWLCKAHRINFYTDVITYNPYEEERDLQDTLEVLLCAQGAYGLGINKLFVLPGTPLAGKMLRDGKTLDDPAREALFSYYCRLFWIASFSSMSLWAVRFFQSRNVFRRKPELIPMRLVRWCLTAVAAVCDVLRRQPEAAAH